MMIRIMLLGRVKVWNLKDDVDVGSISFKNMMAAAMIYHPLCLICLIKLALFNGTN